MNYLLDRRRTDQRQLAATCTVLTLKVVCVVVMKAKKEVARGKKLKVKSRS